MIFLNRGTHKADSGAGVIPSPSWAKKHQHAFTSRIFIVFPTLTRVTTDRSLMVHGIEGVEKEAESQKEMLDKLGNE